MRILLHLSLASDPTDPLTFTEDPEFLGASVENLVLEAAGIKCQIYPDDEVDYVDILLFVNCDGSHYEVSARFYIRNTTPHDGQPGSMIIEDMRSSEGVDAGD